MRKTDELRGPSCLTNAGDDEPLFVLRANDELAPNIVRLWASLYMRKHMMAGSLTPARSDKWGEAIELAVQMEEWRDKRAAVPQGEQR